MPCFEHRTRTLLIKERGDNTRYNLLVKTDLAAVFANAKL